MKPQTRPQSGTYWNKKQQTTNKQQSNQQHQSSNAAPPMHPNKRKIALDVALEQRKRRKTDELGKVGVSYSGAAQIEKRVTKMVRNDEEVPKEKTPDLSKLTAPQRELFLKQMASLGHRALDTISLLSFALEKKTPVLNDIVASPSELDQRFVQLGLWQLISNQTLSLLGGCGIALTFATPSKKAKADYVTVTDVNDAERCIGGEHYDNATSVRNYIRLLYDKELHNTERTYNQMAFRVIDENLLKEFSPSEAALFFRDMEEVRVLLWAKQKQEVEEGRQQEKRQRLERLIEEERMLVENGPKEEVEEQNTVRLEDLLGGDDESDD